MATNRHLALVCVVTLMLSAGCSELNKDGKTANGFKPIFNGKDLSEWEGDMRFWSVQDGAITGQFASNPNKTFYLSWRGSEIDDFELRLSYRIEGEGANSGVQFRSHKTDDGSFVGYQADIGESSGQNWTGFLYEAGKGREPPARRGQKAVIDADGNKQVTSFGDPEELLKHVRAGDWNDYQIIACGNELTLKINGVLMSQAIDQQEGKAARSGTFGLQLHDGPPMKVQFKDIRLKKLCCDGVER